MKIPREFANFVGCFIAHSAEWVENEEEWIAFALHFSPPDRQLAIKRFIEDLLASGMDGRQLNGVWNSCGPSYGPDDGYARAFLTKIKDAIPVDPKRKFVLKDH